MSESTQVETMERGDGFVSTDAWLAWTRTGPSHRSYRASADHGTLNGVTTLCGLEVGGADLTTPFPAESAFACKRCRRALTPRSTP